MPVLRVLWGVVAEVARTMTVYTRKNFPLEVGETWTYDGDELTFVDYPTDGPLFEDEDGEYVQFETEEFSEAWDEWRARTQQEVEEVCEELAEQLRRKGFEIEVGSTGGRPEWYAKVPDSQWPGSDIERVIGISADPR